jgi:hypothetical protein
MKPTKEIIQSLTKARNLIATHGLAKNTFARNRNGKSVDIHSPDAARFCIAGAIAHVEGYKPDETGYIGVTNRMKPFKYLIKAVDHDSKAIVGFNDSRKTTAEDVVTFFDIIIAKAKSDLKA